VSRTPLAAATLVAALAAPVVVPPRGVAQTPAGPAHAATLPLFSSDTPVEITFRTNIRQLRRDRSQKSPWHPATLSYRDSLGRVVRLPARAKTHGIWRLKNCDFPPVRLDFSGRETKHTIFAGVDRPKLVNFCRDTDEYEQYLLQELQLYRVYRTLTPVSHGARLLHLTYVDSASTPTDRPHAVR
jgi:hypothetical protein